MALGLPAVPRLASTGMVASFRLEAIGDNYGRILGDFNRAMQVRTRLPRDHFLRVLYGGVPWVAKITGRDPKYGLAREFIDGRRDYLEANSVGSRGVYLYYLLPEGIYEVNAIESWRRTRRYFIRSQAGKVTEIERSDVDAWLAERSGR